MDSVKEPKYIEDVIETDVSPETIAKIVETDVETEEQKKTRNSPSKKIKTIEHRVELVEEEMKNLRDYIRRLEDFFILKIGSKLPDPPTTVIEPNKRVLKNLDEVAIPEEPVIEKKHRKPREKKVVPVPQPVSVLEPGKKRRGRPPGSKNKKKRK